MLTVKSVVMASVLIGIHWMLKQKSEWNWKFWENFFNFPFRISSQPKTAGDVIFARIAAFSFPYIQKIVNAHQIAFHKNIKSDFFSRKKKKISLSIMISKADRLRLLLLVLSALFLQGKQKNTVNPKYIL